MAKLKILKKYFNKHPALQEFRSDLRELSASLKSLSGDRNTFIHSVLQDYDDKSGNCIFKAIEPATGHGEFRVTTRFTSLHELSNLSQVINNANRWLSEISREIFTRDALSQLETP